MEAAGLKPLIATLRFAITEVVVGRGTPERWAETISIFIIVLQQVDSNVIDPRIAGESTGLPTLWVLVSITLGGGLFGFLGFILSVPLCAVLYTLVKKEVSALSRKKGIPLDDEPDKDPVRKRRTFKELYHGMKKKKASPSEDKK